MDIKLETKETQYPLYILPLYYDEEEDKNEFFTKQNLPELKEDVEKSINKYNFKAKKDQTLSLTTQEGYKVFLIGVSVDYNLESLRRFGAIAYKTSYNMQEEEVVVDVLSQNKEEFKSIVEGLSLASYKFIKYINEKDTKIEPSFVIPVEEESFYDILAEVISVCKNTKEVRNLLNENADVVTPQYFEELCREFADMYSLSIEVLDEDDIKNKGLNLISAVGKGSSNPPRFICIEYMGAGEDKEFDALVGKGITFDTGGINLKPTGFVENMRLDMGGAATAYGIFKTAVEQNLEKNLLLVIPAVENAISGSAYKPGDVYKSYSGKSVEIGNTDAEGRLILADAFEYVQENYKVSRVIDFATLTGAAIIALGHHVTAILGNDKETINKIYDSGERTYERVWELPIYEEHRKILKSKIADIKSVAGREAGTICAGAFLEFFIRENVKWVHLDIAGTAWVDEDSYYLSSFGTGRGVRLFYDYFKNN